MKTAVPSLKEFPEPLAAALGHLLVRFQELESTLLFAVGRFVHPGIEGNPPALTVALLHELPFKSLVALFSSIPRMLSENEPPFPKLSMTDPAVIEAAEAFTVAAKQCNKVEQRRNQLVHSNWLQLQIGPEDGSIYRAKARTSRSKGANQSLTRENQKSVEAAIEEVNRAMLAVFMASAQLNSLIAPTHAA